LFFFGVRRFHAAFFCFCLFEVRRFAAAVVFLWSNLYLPKKAAARHCTRSTKQKKESGVKAPHSKEKQIPLSACVVMEDIALARILALVPHLHYSGFNTRLLQLIGAGPSEHQIKVIALAGPGPLAERFRQHGAEVHWLARLSWRDVALLWKLRRILKQEQPDLIHVWGQSTLRTLALAGGFRVCPVVFEPFLNRTWNNSTGLLDRWLINRCRAVIVPNNTHADRCRSAGIRAARIEVIAPGVATESLAQTLPNCFEPSGHAAGGEADLPAPSASPEAASPLIVCVGPLEAHKGFYDAIWAFDVLRHLHHDLRLWIIGDGPDAGRLKQFVQTLDLGAVVRFWGECADIRPLLEPATAVWVPSRVPSGQQVILEALAAGRPVVASSLPGLAELVVDGKTGFLVAPGARVGFAKKTQQLIAEPALGPELAQAGQDFVATRFNSRQLVAGYRQIYQRMVA
jgi:glycosyltransferase involved in cell wall biosynthesis